MVSCVNLCNYVNLSYQVIQYQEQSAHDVWLYLIGLGIL